MGDSYPPAVGPSTTHRELIPYVIEQPIVVSTGSIMRIESSADAPRRIAFSDERSTAERSSDRHKV